MEGPFADLQINLIFLRPNIFWQCRLDRAYLWKIFVNLGVRASKVVGGISGKLSGLSLNSNQVQLQEKQPDQPIFYGSKMHRMN